MLWRHYSSGFVNRDSSKLRRWYRGEVGDRLLAKFETSDYAQMRRCRMAHLYGQTVDEMFEGGVVATGFVDAVRPDLTSWPMRWTITVKPQTADVPKLELQD